MARRLSKAPTRSREKPANQDQKIIKGVKSVVEFVPRTMNQAKLVKACENPNTHIVFVTGAAGTGKTYIVAKYAIKQLLDPNSNIEKIMITRPNVEAGEKLGALPGGILEKMEPWVLPIFDVFMEENGITKNEITNLIAMGKIEIAPFNYLRGRTAKNAIFIGDEMQNSDTNQMKMLLTRIGEGSKIFITGDLEQSDRSWKAGASGLQYFIEKFERYSKDKTGIEFIKFGPEDIQRHPIIGTILKIYDNPDE